MRKKLGLMLALISLLSLCACGSANVENTPAEEESPTSHYVIQTDEALEAAIRQAAVNKCCEETYVEKLGGFEIGTSEGDFIRGEPVHRVTVSGSFYPIDKYGDYGDYYLFDLTLEINLETGYSTCTKDYVRRKY